MNESGIMNRKKLEKAIYKAKMKLLEECHQDEELMEVFDTLQVVAIYFIDESSHRSNKSETSYHKDIPRILEIIMRGTSFDLGE